MKHKKSIMKFVGSCQCINQQSSPVVTNLNLSSSSATSSSSTFLPGKKNPIILLKNWYISWMVRGTTFTWRRIKHQTFNRQFIGDQLRWDGARRSITSKCSFTEIPPTGGRTLLKMRSANWRADWQVLWGRSTTCDSTARSLHLKKLSSTGV